MIRYSPLHAICWARNVVQSAVCNPQSAIVVIAMLAAFAFGCRPSGTVRVEPAVAAATDDTLVFAETATQFEPGDAGVDGFTFPNDSGGKALERILPPNNATRASVEDRAGPKPRRNIRNVEDPEAPFTPPPTELPKLPVGKGKPLRPRSAPESMILESYRDQPVLPQRLELPPTVLLRIPAPDAHAVPALPIQARHVFDRASLDDPTAELSSRDAVAAGMPLRAAPASFWRFNLPEPQVLRGPSPDPGVEMLAPVLRPLR